MCHDLEALVRKTFLGALKIGVQQVYIGILFMRPEKGGPCLV